LERMETPYASKDIALSLDIGDSTLRKWCLALEEHELSVFTERTRTSGCSPRRTSLF
jgi:transposase-like protein